MTPKKSFSTVAKSETFTLTDGNTETVYTVKEFKKSAKDTWTASEMRKVKMSPTGEVLEILDFKPAQVSLLSLCLYGPDDKLVDPSVMEGWPASTVEGIYEIAVEVCGLKDASEETDPKKD